MAIYSVITDSASHKTNIVTAESLLCIATDWNADAARTYIHIKAHIKK